MRINRAITLALGLCVFLGPQLRAANIVSNPGFETGDLTGWARNGQAGYAWQVGLSLGSSKVANSGTYYAGTGCGGPTCITGLGPNGIDGPNYLYQDLETVAGERYTLSFYFSSDGSPMELKALFGSTTAFDLVNLLVDSSPLYQFYSATVTATGATTRLQFLGYQNAGTYNALDDVSVVDAGSGAPEPATWFMLGSAMFALRVARRR